MGTRALMQQQGHLIGYDGTVARIGIRSKPLFKMAQGRVANIEAAFQLLFNQTVKVTLEVADGPPGELPPGAPPAGGTPVGRPPSPPPAPTPPGAAVASAPAAPPVEPAPTAAVAPPPAPTPEWQPASDFDRAVKSFAEFFNGQIVDLDAEEEDAGQSRWEKRARPDPAKPSTSPGSDVPF